LAMPLSANARKTSASVVVVVVAVFIFLLPFVVSVCCDFKNFHENTLDDSTL